MPALGWKELIALWGALTGTAGMLISFYALRLVHRSTIPKVELEQGKAFSEVDEGHAIRIRFECSASNKSNTEASLAYFTIDLGKTLNKIIRTEKENNAGPFKLSHYTKAGNFMRLPGTRTDTGDYGKPITISANGYIPTIYLSVLLYPISGAESSTSTALRQCLKQGQYTIMGHLPDGQKTILQGKMIEWQT